MADIDFKALASPFPAEDIDWRPGATNKDRTRAIALAFITARAVMDRLDAVCGPANWKDTYLAGPGGGVVCRLSIRIDGEWVTKEDAAENSDVEPVKGGISDALKRAAVKWGIGRYLYELPSPWVECEAAGKSVRLAKTPTLPAWALPGGTARPAHVERPANVERPAPAPVDTDTGEIVAKREEPAPAPAGQAPTPAGQSDIDMWNAFTACFIAQHITRAQVSAFLGGFNASALSQWMNANNEHDPVAVVMRIKNEGMNE